MRPVRAGVKRWTAGLMALALGLMAPACGGADSAGADNAGAYGGETVRPDSEARVYARQVKADLDVTTLGDLMAQMPEGVQPEISRSGLDRTYAWTFSDGSRIVATFRPRGGEGSQQGLVLYMVDIT